MLAFKDINPAAPIHILVVPKQHIENVLEINEENKEIASNIFLAINKIAKQLGIDQNGFRVITNCGKDAGQAYYYFKNSKKYNCEEQLYLLLLFFVYNAVGDILETKIINKNDKKKLIEWRYKK